MLFYTDEILRVVKTIEMESKKVVARGYYVMGIVFQFYKTKGVLEMDGGDGCTILRIFFEVEFRSCCPSWSAMA